MRLQRDLLYNKYFVRMGKMGGNSQFSLSLFLSLFLFLENIMPASGIFLVRSFLLRLSKQVDIRHLVMKEQAFVPGSSNRLSSSRIDVCVFPYMHVFS